MASIFTLRSTSIGIPAKLTSSKATNKLYTRDFANNLSHNVKRPDVPRKKGSAFVTIGNNRLTKDFQRKQFSSIDIDIRKR